jgi:polysaccharide pyruvyl transferase WcaK-like protein
MGVNAFTYSMLRYLEEVAEQLNIRFTYTILGHGAGYRDGCMDKVVINGKDVPFRFEQVTIPGNIEARQVGHWVTLLRWLVRKGHTALNSLSQYDLIFDISEGDSFTDIYGSGRFVQMSLSKMLALVAGKTLVLLPQTIGPFDHPVSATIARQLMRRIRYIFPRDRSSLHYLQQAFPGRVFHEYLDVAFHLPYERTCFASQKIHVGFNISALLWQGGYTHDNMFDLQVNYQQLMRDIIRYFLEKEDVVVHLVPHVVSHDGLSREDDFAVIAQLHTEMPNTILAPAFKDPIEAKSYISGLDFFAGSRMHSCIAAYSSSVPVMPMAYSRKFSGLFLSSLNYPILVDLRQDDQDQACRKIVDGFERRMALRQAILDQKNLIEDNIAAFRRELANLIREVYENRGA